MLHIPPNKIEKSTIYIYPETKTVGKILLRQIDDIKKSIDKIRNSIMQGDCFAQYEPQNPLQHIGVRSMRAPQCPTYKTSPHSSAAMSSEIIATHKVGSLTSHFSTIATNKQTRRKALSICSLTT
jgi:serine/threonine protein kinase HipA of HipAB toxin-antitoxin module